MVRELEVALVFVLVLPACVCLLLEEELLEEELLEEELLEEELLEDVPCDAR